MTGADRAHADLAPGDVPAPPRAEGRSVRPAAIPRARGPSGGKLGSAIKTAVTLGLLAVVLVTVDLRAFWESVRGADWGLLAAALALFQVGMVVRAERWRVLLAALRREVSLGRLTALYYVGTFFSNVLPSGLGGDVVRVYELAQGQANGVAALSTVVWDRIIGLLMLYVLALAVLPFAWHLVPLSVSLALLALVAGTLLALAALCSRRLLEALARRLPLAARLAARDDVRALYATYSRYSAATMARAAAASLLFNLLNIASQALTARALAIPLGLGQLVLFVTLISTLLTLPISIAGLGVREGAHVVLFAQAGVAPAQALAMSLITHAIHLVTGLAGGVYYAWANLRGLGKR